MQDLCILGSTGSIGQQTLDVLHQHQHDYHIRLLSAHSSIERLYKQCCQFAPEYAHMADSNAAQQLVAKLKAANCPTKVLSEIDTLIELVSKPKQTIMAAMSGAQGLAPVLAALQNGNKVLLANKESIVMAGKWVLDAARRHGGVIIPVDSEHNSIYQVLSDDYVVGDTIPALDKIILTASGGPFWRLSLDELASVNIAQALAHPTWQMGQKITIDSATLMNKALEMIEAKWLFALEPDQIDVLIHPQSIVHSFVAYQDGAQLAQVNVPDMRLSIAYSLNMKRWSHVVKKLDLTQQPLEFYPAPTERFHAIKLANQVIKAGGDAACVFNAANEIAVQAFLQQKIKFSQIIAITDTMLQKFACTSCSSIDGVMALDTEVRQVCKTWIESLN